MSHPAGGAPPASRAAKRRFKRSVFAAILHGDKVLTVTELNGQVGFPGGKVNQDEPWMKALAREFREEIGGKLPFGRYSLHAWGTQTFEVRFFTTRVSDAEALALTRQAGESKSTDVASWAWVPRHELPALPLRPHIRTAVALFDTLASSSFGRESAWGRAAPRRILKRDPAAATLVPAAVPSPAAPTLAATTPAAPSSSAAALPAASSSAAMRDKLAADEADETATTSESEEEAGEDEGEGGEMRALDRSFAGLTTKNTEPDN